MWSSDLWALAPLPIYIFEIRPLIYQDGNTIKGTWYQSFERLEKLSELEFSYQFMSISRLELSLIKDRPGCALTLIKTPEREAMKINFITEHSDKTLLSFYQRTDDHRQFALNTLKTTQGMRLATNTPSAVNALKKWGIQSELLFNINSIVRMLILKRVDGIVGSNLAIEKMPEFKSGKIHKSFLVKSLAHGIACSPGTPPEYISRLKKATKSWSLN